MNEEFSTDDSQVNDVTSQLSRASAEIDFTPTGNIHYSESSATAELKEVLIKMTSVVDLYKSCLSQDINNLQALHNAILEMDNKAKLQMDQSMA